MDDKKLRKKYGKQYGYEVLFKGQPAHPTGKTGSPGEKLSLFSRKSKK